MSTTRSLLIIVRHVLFRHETRLTCRSAAGSAPVRNQIAPSVVSQEDASDGLNPQRKHHDEATLFNRCGCGPRRIRASGCGVSNQLAANPTGHGTVRVSDAIHTNGLRENHIHHNHECTFHVDPQSDHCSYRYGCRIRWQRYPFCECWPFAPIVPADGPPSSALQLWNRSNPAVRGDSTMFGPNFEHGIPIIPAVTLNAVQSAEQTFVETVNLGIFRASRRASSRKTIRRRFYFRTGLPGFARMRKRPGKPRGTTAP